MSHAVDTRATSSQADDAVAFRHLLHEVASHITGLGLTLEMLGEPGTTAEDTAAMVGTARGALDDLRHLIGDIGELKRFLHRHGALRAETVAVGDLLADLEAEGLTVAPADRAAAAALPPVRVDRMVVGFTLELLASACGRLPGVAVTIAAMPVGAAFVRIEACAAYEDRPGVRRALEKAPMVVDHFCNAMARDMGGRFVREQSRTGQRVGFVLPAA